MCGVAVVLFMIWICRMLGSKVSVPNIPEIESSVHEIEDMTNTIQSLELPAQTAGKPKLNLYLFYIKTLYMFYVTRS